MKIHCAILGQIYYFPLHLRPPMYIPDVEDVVTPDQDLPEVASLSPVNVLLGVGQLEVHVAVCGNQVTCR